MSNGISRDVNTRFWTDTKVSRMTLEEKHMFLYLCTSPHSNPSGFYELPISLVSKEIGLHEDEIKKLICSLKEKWRVIDFDDSTSEVLICNKAKYSWTTSPKFMGGVFNYCKNLKNRDMKHYIEFLVKFSYGITTWDSSVCDYYEGSWRESCTEND